MLCILINSCLLLDFLLWRCFQHRGSIGKRSGMAHILNVSGNPQPCTCLPCPHNRWPSNRPKPNIDSTFLSIAVMNIYNKSESSETFWKQHNYYKGCEKYLNNNYYIKSRFSTACQMKAEIRQEADDKGCAWQAVLKKWLAICQCNEINTMSCVTSFDAMWFDVICDLMWRDTCDLNINMIWKCSWVGNL